MQSHLLQCTFGVINNTQLTVGCDHSTDVILQCCEYSPVISVIIKGFHSLYLAVRVLSCIRELEILPTVLSIIERL